MHHLEARFDFALAREQLNRNGIEGMAPFSDFEFLKQAFTQGERWPVLPERANRLYRDGLITKEQLDRFLHKGSNRQPPWKPFSAEEASRGSTRTASAL
jgi:hypothetical protein